MLLYNVSFNPNDNLTNILIPNIPDSAGSGENRTIKRVCLANSVENCMRAIAVGNRDIGVGANFILREVNIDSKDKNLIHPNILQSTKYVPDAIVNMEYWYLKPIKVTVSACKILDFDSEIRLNFEIITAEQCREKLYLITKQFNLNRYKNSKNMYNAFLEQCDKYRLYTYMDEAWEKLAEVPYSQGRSLVSLKYIKNLLTK